MKKIAGYIAQFWKDKPVIFLIVVAVLIWIVYKIIHGAVNKSKAKSNYQAAVDQSQTALNQLASQGVKPSYGQAEYSSWANAIQMGFTGCGSGWAAVLKPTMDKMKNDADVYALIQNYGVRKIAECGWGEFEGDLSATIGYKFSGYRFCDCVPLFTCDGDHCGSVLDINKLLKSKGIVFQF